MRIRWAIAVVGVLALSAVAVNFYMPWLKNNQPLTSNTEEATGAKTLSCPVDAKPANLDFTMKDVAGKNVTLADFKGKVILLDFWATWCGPCKIEIPWFSEFQEKYASQGLQVVGISVDDTPDKLEPYVKEMKMNYLVLQGLGHEEVQDAYGPILGIPVTALISRDGKICSKHTGMGTKETFEDEIRSLL